MRLCFRVACSAEDLRRPLLAGVLLEATLRLPPVPLLLPEALNACLFRPLLPPSSSCSSLPHLGLLGPAAAPLPGPFGPLLLLLLLLLLLPALLLLTVAENANGPLRTPLEAGPVRLPKANSDEPLPAAAAGRLPLGAAACLLAAAFSWPSTIRAAPLVPLLECRAAFNSSALLFSVSGFGLRKNLKGSASAAAGEAVGRTYACGHVLMPRHPQCAWLPTAHRMLGGSTLLAADSSSRGRLPVSACSTRSHNSPFRPV